MRITNAGVKALTLLKDLEVLNMNLTSVTYRAKEDLMQFKVCCVCDVCGYVCVVCACLCLSVCVS